ncbi:nicotinamidase-related amidase [Sphingomonas sp. UYAg733]
MPQPLPAPRRGLIVIDVQNEYFDGALPIGYPSVEVSLPNIIESIRIARLADVPIAIVRHVNPADAAAFAQGSRGAALHSSISVQSNDHVIGKTKPSVFTGTDFAEWIEAHRLNALTIVGYMTQNCIVATTLEAAHRGYMVEILSDASGALGYANAAGAATAEEMHRVLTVIFHANFGAVASTAEWIDAVSRRAALPRGSLLASAQLEQGRSGGRLDGA